MPYEIHELFKWHVYLMKESRLEGRSSNISYFFKLEEWHKNVQLNQSISILQIDARRMGEYYSDLQFFFAVSSHLSSATEVARLLNDGMINNQSITMLLLNAF